MAVPFIDLSRVYRKSESRISEVISNLFLNQRWILGEDVIRFEEEFAKYVGVKYAIGVASGTDALLIGLRSISIKRFGREFFERDQFVITTPFTFVATAETIIRSGASVLFVDVDRDTANIDVEMIDRACQEYNVVGVVPVHLYGNPCNMDRLLEICNKHNLFIVEDCAQSFGARWRDKFLGAFGDCGAFSFFPTKNLCGIGDGGMITTSDEDICRIAKMLRNHGGIDKYDIRHIGYNSRLDSIQAAVLRVYLRNVDEWINERLKVFSYYNENLSDKLGRFSAYKFGKTSANVYTVICPTEEVRLSMVDRLVSEEIGFGIYYPKLLSSIGPIRRFSLVYGELKNAKYLSNRVISLACFPYMNKEELEQVVGVVNEAVMYM